MSGFLTGAVQELREERANDLSKMQLGIEQQRVNSENAREARAQAQTDRENRRQDLGDQITGTAAEMQDLVNGVAPLNAIVSGAPAAPGGLRPADPALAQQWDAAKKAHDDYTGADEYKAAQNKIKSAQERGSEILGRHNALTAKLAGEYTGEVNDDAATTDFNLAHGGVDGASGRQLAHWSMARYGQDPSIWVKDPKTGTSRAEAAAQSIVQGAQTGNFDGREADVSLLMPELHLAVGSQLPNGNTVTGAQATHLFVDPKDPTKIHVSHALQHEDDAGGNQGVLQSPHMADDGLTIPIDTLKQRAQALIQGVGIMGSPAAQRKLSGAMQDGDTALHDFFRTAQQAGAAGVAPQYQKLGRGESLVSITPGQAPRVAIEGKQYVPGNEAIFNELQEAYASGDQDRIQAAELASRSLHPSKYQVGGGAGGGAAGGGKQKYTVGEQNDAKESLRNAVAQKYGADLSDLAKGEDVFSRIPDKKKAAQARDDFARARNKLNNDLSSGKPNVDYNDYLPKDEKADQGTSAPHEQAADIKAQFQQGKLTREEARAKLQALVSQHGQEKVVAPPGARPATAAGPRAAAAGAASPSAKPAQVAADQGAATRKLAEPVNYKDYVSTGPSGASRNVDADLHAAEGSLTQLQQSMGDQSLPESVRSDMQHRFAAELMRKNELLAVKQKLSGG